MWGCDGERGVSERGMKFFMICRFFGEGVPQIRYPNFPKAE